MKYNSYILASNCKLVKGFSRSLLLDLQRQRYIFLNKEQEKFLSQPITINQVNDLSNRRFINKLLSEEILLNIDSKLINNFPKLSDNFHNQTTLNNAIIELSKTNIKYFETILTSLNNLGCKFVELRVMNDVSIYELKKSIKHISETTIQSIDIYFKYVPRKFIQELLNIKREFIEVRWIFIYETPPLLSYRLNLKRDTGVLYIKQGINEKECGNISPFYFHINISMFTESLKFNTCLNCKLSITKHGEIKKCPSMAISLGNIKNDSIEKIVNKSEFTKLDTIVKDEIDACKDCEFRYICTDCRAYVEDPKDIYSKPLKCGYDPYTGRWEEWSLNPLKKKAINYYEL